MNNGEVLFAAVAGYLFAVVGGALAITQGSQYFWSQQHLHAVHRGSAMSAAFGIAVTVMGIAFLLTAFRQVVKD